MPKTTRSARRTQLRRSLVDLYLETLREIAPRSSQRFINSAIEMLEGHRELLAEHVARLEKARSRISSGGGQRRARKVSVRKGRARSRTPSA